MSSELITLTYHDTFATVTLNNPARRNALSLNLMLDLTRVLRDVAESGVRGVILAANGSVFSAGHDFADVVDRDLPAARHLLKVCTEMMETIQEMPQPVLARVQGLATAAGCQLVATCDLGVASTNAGFAVPGGKGGWFCTTPMVALSRNIGRKRALEMLMTGDVIDAQTACAWGLVNRVVAPEQLEEEALRLLTAATRGSWLSKAMGKQAFYAQIDLPQHQAYHHAIEVMASTSQLPDAQEGMHAFLEKRPARFAPPPASGKQEDAAAPVK